jgi:hypothetical protein
MNCLEAQEKGWKTRLMSFLFGYSHLYKIKRIGVEEEAVWNCENIDHYHDYYYKLIECSLCGRKEWVSIEEDEFRELRDYGYRQLTDEKVPSMAFPIEAEKYGWNLDRVYALSADTKSKEAMP